MTYSGKLADFLSEINGILIKNDLPSVTYLYLMDDEMFLHEVKHAINHNWTPMQWVAYFACVEPESLAPSEPVYPAGAYPVMSLDN